MLAGHTGDIDMVLKALEHELPMVRDVALGALSRMDKLEIEILRRFRTDPDARVRKRVAELAATFPDFDLLDRKSTRLNSSHVSESRMPSSA